MSSERNEQNVIVGAGRKIAAVNALSASVVEFVSRLLIEKAFFQNSNIPQQSLLYLANDLIRTLCPEKNVKFSVAKEIAITYKQLRGQPLTPEEQKYEYADTELDVAGEVLNGIKYSTMGLLGKNLCDSIYSTVQQGLWSHVPAVAGYTGALLFGPQAISSAVDNALFYSGLRSDQKELIRPWLSTVGRLAIGLVPKVHANETGVHYHYPSVSGHTETYSRNESVSMHGENVTIKRSGTFNTPEGAFAAEYLMQFKLHQINQLSGQSIRIQVVNQSGEKIPVEFNLKQGDHGPEIQVKSTDPQLQAHWSSYFREPAGLIDSKPEKNYAELISVSQQELPPSQLTQYISALSNHLDGQQAGRLMTLALAVVLCRQTNNKLLPRILLASSLSSTATAHRIPDSVFIEHKSQQKALNEIREEMEGMFEDIGIAVGGIPIPVISIPLGMANSRLKHAVDDFLNKDPKTTLLRDVLWKKYEDIRTSYGNGDREAKISNPLQSKLKAAQLVMEIINDKRIDIDDVHHQLPTIVEFLRYQQDATQLLSNNYNALSFDMQEHGRRLISQGSQLNAQGQTLAEQGGILTNVSSGMQALVHSSAQSASRIAKVADRIVQVQKLGKITLEDVKNLKEDLTALQVDVDEQTKQNRQQFSQLISSQEEATVVHRFLFDQAIAVNTAGFEANQEIMKLQDDLHLAQTQHDVSAVISKNYALKQAIAKEQQRAISVERKLNTLGDGFALVAIGVQFFGKPKLAHQISTIGNAAVTIGKSMASLVGVGAAAAASGPLAPVVAIAGALLTVFSLFADNGPSPEEVIIEQIGKLQEQLHIVRKEMHDRFDHVDKLVIAHHEFTKVAFKGLSDMLTDLHKVMGYRFDHIENMLIDIHKDMVKRFIGMKISAQEIKVIAISIKSQMDNVERIIESGFRTIYHQNYQQKLRAALDYHSTANIPAMNPETLNDYYSTIRHFATRDSTHQIFTGDPNLNQDEDVVKCLARGIENCINVFAAYANENFKIGHFADLPNPVVYAEGTSNLLEFALNMPEFNIRAKIKDFDEVKNTGNRFVAFIKHLKTNGSLSNGLLQNYRDAIQSVIIALVDVLAKMQNQPNMESIVQESVLSVLPPNIAQKSNALHHDMNAITNYVKLLHSHFSQHIESLDAVEVSARHNADGAREISNAIGKLAGSVIYNPSGVTTGQSCNKALPILGRISAFAASTYRYWWGGDNCDQVVPALEAANQIVREVQVAKGLVHPLVVLANKLHNEHAVSALTSGKHHHQDLRQAAERLSHLRNLAEGIEGLTKKSSDIYEKMQHNIDFFAEYFLHHIDPVQLADFNRRLLREASSEGSVFSTVLNRLRLAQGVLVAYISLAFNDEMLTSHALQEKLQKLTVPLTHVMGEYNYHKREGFIYHYIKNTFMPIFDSLAKLVTEKVLESKELQSRKMLQSGYRVVERSLLDLSFFSAAYSSREETTQSKANSNEEDFTCTVDECNSNRQSRGAN